MGDLKNEDIDIIKNFILTQKLPNLSEEQIRMFILSGQNNLQVTKDRILSYFSIKKKNPKMFGDYNLEREDLQLQANTSKFCVFPRKTDDECIIVYSGLRDYSYQNYVQEPSCKLLVMTLEAAIVYEKPKGFILLIDMEGMTLMHTLKVKLGVQKLFVRYIQEACPVNLKSAHFLNCSYVMDKLISVLKPFISREMFEITYFHTSNMNMDDFYANCIPKKCLPQEYGGDLPGVEDLHVENIKKLGEMKVYFQTKEKELKQWNNKNKINN